MGMEPLWVSHVALTAQLFPSTHNMESLAEVESALGFVAVNPLHGFCIEVFDKKTFDFEALVGDDIEVTEWGAEFPKVSENGGRIRKVFARQLTDQGSVGEGPVNKKVLTR
jgi:hypothetical protein